MKSGAGERSGSPSSRRGGARVAAVARLSLLALALTLLCSCLVDDPPPYTKPKQTPPRLDYHNASPLLDALIVADTGDLLRFEVPVTSEDAGDPLALQLFLDEDIKEVQTLAAGTLENRDRSTNVPYRVDRKDRGCHRFKLRVAHRSNLPSASGPALDPNDVAEAYWWANLNVAAAERGTLKDCPVASFVEPEL